MRERAQKVLELIVEPGREPVDAVLNVDTGAGGELCGGYLWDGQWFHLDELVSRVGVATRGDVYPFDYSRKVPLKVNDFH